MPTTPALSEPLVPFANVNCDGTWSPPVDIDEYPDRYTLTVDLPGVTPNTLQVIADRGVLTITGVRRDRLGNPRSPVRIERPGGRFHRSLPLPEGSDCADLRTYLSDGVLEISLRKRKGEPRRIVGSLR